MKKGLLLAAPFLFIRNHLMTFVGLVLLLSFTVQPAEDELSAVVEAYWSAVAKRDKVQAMRYVHPEDLNNFLNRVDASFENWRLTETKMVSETEAVVAVTIDRFLLNAVLPFQVKETWIQTEDGWKVRVPRPQSVAERIHKKASEVRPVSLPEELRIRPAVVRFYALTPDQPASLIIQNGLGTSLEVVSFEVDLDLFEIVKKVDVVEARSRGRFMFKYRGKERQKQQQHLAVLTIRQEGKVQRFEVPIVCNYRNAITDWVERQRGSRTGRKPEPPSPRR
jgi:hypothetical protein